MEAKIRKVGNSLGVILPKKFVEDLHLKKGDRLSIESENGNIKLSPIDPEFEDWAEAYRSANAEYRDVLKELAK